MICDVCEKEKHCISIDVEWTLLDTVCEECWEKECDEHYGYIRKSKGVKKVNTPSMLPEFMYALMKEARRYDLTEFLETWSVSQEDYEDIEKWFKQELGIEL